MALILPRRKHLTLPGTTSPLIPGPDPRGLLNTTPSAAPLSLGEIDYDDLQVLRSWRVYRDDAPAEVKYFCYELLQQEPGAGQERYFKAVRLFRLTRVPRYLRNTGASSGHVFTQMRDVLVGLREKRVLFLNVIAKSPKLPLVFAYGVQGTGDTLEEAMQIADEAYAALTFNLDGTYQQLEYAPLKFEEAEALARYQSEWNHIAMARGRPMPQGVALGSSAIFDGNRTDVENTNNQLESFIRGMGDKSFMLSLVTVPLAPADMTSAWDNITRKLSAVRSDQSGSRGFVAGVALPLGAGVSLGDTTGTSHGTTATSGEGTSDGLSQSHSQSVAVTSVDAVGQTTSVINTDALSQSQTDTVSTATALGQGLTQTDGVSAQSGQGYSSTQGTSVAEGLTQSQSLTDAQAVSQTNTVGQSVTAGQTLGQSLSDSASSTANWSQSATQGVSAGQSLGSNWSQSYADGMNQNWSLGSNNGSSASSGSSLTNTSGLNGGLPVVGGNTGESSTITGGVDQSNGNSVGVSQGWSGTNTAGVGGTSSSNLGSSSSLGESAGGSQGRTVTAGTSLANSLSQSSSLSQSQGQTLSQSVSNGLAQSQTVGSSQAVANSTSAAVGTSSSVGNSANLTQSAGEGRALGTGASQAVAQGVSNSVTHADGTSVGQGTTQGASTGVSSQRALSDAWQTAMSRQATQSGSLGVVPTLAAQFSKNTYDEAKRIVGDLLQAQADRYMDGIEGGGMLYQLFLTAPDRETLVGASTLLKSAFWGGGGENRRLTSPFHTIVVEDHDEADRLLTHARAFSTYRKREPASELIEPYFYSSFVTTGEASAMCHPPTAEAIGLQAQVDSMPVMAMPANRGDRDIYMGHIINGERGRVSDASFGVDISELTHILIQGVTGLGKTTTAMRLMEQAVRLEKDVVTPPTTQDPYAQVTKARAGMLVLDWMRNARNLAQVVEEDRFQLYSVSNPELGQFRFNPLAIPHPGMDPGQWLGAQADNLATSFGLGQFGRSILSELVDALYSANRLEEYILRPAVVDDVTGQVLRDAIVLPPVEGIPDSAIRVDGAGNRYANVYTYPQLSRLVGLPEVAVLVANRVEVAATPEGARLYGTEMRNRLQSVWRRIQYYAPGNPMGATVAPDPDLQTRECLTVPDLVDPDRGLVTVIETDGLDLEYRRVVLGSVMLAVYRYGLHVGAGCYDHNGQGPGTFIVLEEAHELLGESTEGEDRESSNMRVALYESLFRRARATGLHLVVMTQNCGQIPAAITSQTTTVFVHRTYDDNDRKRVFSLLNWSNMIGQQQREWRYLGEMPRGYCIVRLDARDSYLESAPVQILVDPPDLPEVPDEVLKELARRRNERGNLS